jgi:hypothetical protein
MTEDQLQRFRKLEGQLESAAKEVAALSSVNPDAAVNQVKVRLLSLLLAVVGEFLGAELGPFDEPVELSDQTSNSDATVVLGQYQACMTEYRRRHTTRRYGKHYWVVGASGGDSSTTRYVLMEPQPDTP